MSSIPDSEAIPVRLLNAEDIKISAVEEHEPEHFISNAYLLPAPGPAPAEADAALNQPVQILNLDLMRKEAVISVTGNGNVYLAHSAAQAQSLQTSSDQPADGGFLAVAPCTFRVEGTGPLWAVAQSGSGSGTAQQVVSASAAPAAGAAGSATLPLYVNGPQYITGFNVSTKGDGTVPGVRTIFVQNVQGGTETYYINDTAGSPDFVSVQFPGLGLQASGGDPQVSISALASGSSSIINVYGTNQAGTIPVVVVGVLQERRGI